MLPVFILQVAEEKPDLVCSHSGTQWLEMNFHSWPSLCFLLKEKQCSRAAFLCLAYCLTAHSDAYLLFFFFFNFGFIYLFIYFWLCWVFVPVRGLSLVAASGGHSSSRCAGLSLSRPLLLWSTGSRRAGSVIVAHGPSCSATCGIFPDQGSNPCPLHWQADSQPLRHQGSPRLPSFPASSNPSICTIWYHSTSHI